jgi:rod shape-determining protein MreC
MIQTLLERKTPLLLFAVLFILLVVLSSQAKGHEGGSILEGILFRLVTPVARLADALDERLTRWVEEYVDLRLARVENLGLKEELGLLQLERQRWEQERQEYRRLLGVLGLKEMVRRPALAARVVSRGHGLGATTMIINRGAGDGVAPNHPVIVPAGVVGRVIEVGPSTAKVQLMLDPNSSVAALSERSRAQGMVNGRGERLLRMDYVSDLEDVQPGDRIVTSGLDRLFPPGLPLGTVLRAERGGGLVQSIEVEPAADFGKLEEVLVLLESAGEGA